MASGRRWETGDGRRWPAALAGGGRADGDVGGAGGGRRRWRWRAAGDVGGRWPAGVCGGRAVAGRCFRRAGGRAGEEGGRPKAAVPFFLPLLTLV